MLLQLSQTLQQDRRRVEEFFTVEVDDGQRCLRFDEGALLVLFALEDEKQFWLEFIDEGIEGGQFLTRTNVADLLCGLDVNKTRVGEEIAEPAFLAEGVGHARAGGEQ